MSKKNLKGRNADKNVVNIDAYIEGSGEIIEQPIVDTLQKNYMPYAMSVIVSRALPQIDGFKPSHRKILYTMYKMGLLNGAKTKSANIVGQTMKLNPHGDSAIYETLVRLSRGYAALLHPYVDSKGNFGKFYSRDMAYAASRYTESKLDGICKELFSDIDKDTVDFVPNYDNTETEPTLLPTTFPSVLVNLNMGIAVSMASSICSFNLKEICDATIKLINDENSDISDVLKGPDFSCGGLIIYDKNEFDKILNTGRGSIRIRSRYFYDKEYNCLEITEIPQTTTIEVIIDKVVECIKQGKIKEINDIRDESGLYGLKIAIDLKRGVNPDLLMQKLYRFTTLEDTFSCNFNVLIDYKPRVMGVYDILKEWIKFRIICVKRRTNFSLDKKCKKLHLLLGLQKILVDIDKAISIIRSTENDSEVIPNLMKGFEIDEIQAEYVSEIKLRNLNKQYIFNKTKDIKLLESEISELKSILQDESKIRAIICDELHSVGDKYGQQRKSLLVYSDDVSFTNIEDEVADYPVHLFLTAQGYLKKILPKSLKMSSDHKLKAGDSILFHIDTKNNFDVLFISDKHKVYKYKVKDFTEVKASLMGDYLPAIFGVDQEEKILYMVPTSDYKGYLFFFFKNGKCAKVPLQSYFTKTNRKKLSNAYSNKSKLLFVFYENYTENCYYEFKTILGRKLIVRSDLIASKVSRNNNGIQVLKINKNDNICSVRQVKDISKTKLDRFIAKQLPEVGVLDKTDRDQYQIKI